MSYCGQSLIYGVHFDTSKFQFHILIIFLHAASENDTFLQPLAPALSVGVAPLEYHNPPFPAPRHKDQQEARLLSYLMMKYDKDVRPILNVTEAVQVHVGITLTQIFDMVS